MNPPPRFEAPATACADNTDDAPAGTQRHSEIAQKESQTDAKQTQRKTTPNAFIADQNNKKIANSAHKTQATKERITDWLP